MILRAKAAAQKQLPTKSCSCITSLLWVYTHLLLLLILSLQPVFSGQVVMYLPDGEIPYKLENGYISVGDSGLLYYFIESQGNPQEDPIFLCLPGGPGCSAFNGLIYEIGPMEFDIENYTGGLPKLKKYPYEWTNKTASIIFVDTPAGTGFSYEWTSWTSEGWPTSNSKSAEQSYQLLKKWLIEHPQYLKVQLFLVGGDSCIQLLKSKKPYIKMDNSSSVTVEIRSR